MNRRDADRLQDGGGERRTPGASAAPTLSPTHKTAAPAWTGPKQTALGEDATELFAPPLDSGTPGCGPAPQTPWPRHPLARSDLLLAAVLFCLALVVRWPFLMVGETLLNPDEAIVGLMAMDIAAGEQLPIYFYGQRYMGSLEAFIIAAVLPLFEDPIHALRFGPALVFAFLTVLQYLMLTRWFGRRGGLIGAVTLLACSPMFMHWSISARGGYIEILLWGSAVLWAYSEWFVPGPFRSKRASRGSADSMAAGPARSPVERRHQLLLGLLIGSGLWINPSIAFFVLPILLHALLNRPLASAQTWRGVGTALAGLRRSFGSMTLAVLGITGVLALNLIWSTWVDEGIVRHEVLLGLLPMRLGAGLLMIAAVPVGVLIVRKTQLLATARRLATAYSALIFGLVLGAGPSFVYAFQAAVGLRPMDPSLPMGLRPLWKIGETLIYLAAGLPQLFAADGRPFMRLLGVGRPDVLRPLDITMHGLTSAANWVVLGGIVTVVIVLLWSQRRFIMKILKLQPENHPPHVLLMLAFVTTIALYLLGGCTMNHTTVRYLVPLWAFVPGLLAAASTSPRLRRAAVSASLCLCAAWAAGQVSMHTQLGRPHPLRPLATALETRGIRCGIAEPLDAHLLSFMTRRASRLAEFESFWVRLPHHRRLIDPDKPANYIVETGPYDWTADLERAGWQGQLPLESLRFMWRKLQREITQDPSIVLSREPLTERYELIRLHKPLSERDDAP